LQHEAEWPVGQTNKTDILEMPVAETQVCDCTYEKTRADRFSD
jgi:hypothetical protein